VEIEIIQTTDVTRLSKLNKEVQELHVKLYPEHFKPFNLEEVSSFFQKIMSNPSYLFFLAKKDHEDVGYLWVELKEYKENVFTKSYRSVYIHHLNVIEKYRNLGVGSNLIEKVHNIARENGINKIELDYWADNEFAQRFYEKHGYKNYREFAFREI